MTYSLKLTGLRVQSPTSMRAGAATSDKRVLSNEVHSSVVRQYEREKILNGELWGKIQIDEWRVWRAPYALSPI